MIEFPTLEQVCQLICPFLVGSVTILKLTPNEVQSASNHQPEEIIGEQFQAEIVVAQGASVVDACRRIGSRGTATSWRKKYGGLKIYHARWMKELEQESARLRRAVRGSMNVVRASMAHCATTCSKEWCSSVQDPHRSFPTAFEHRPGRKARSAIGRQHHRHDAPSYPPPAPCGRLWRQGHEHQTFRRRRCQEQSAKCVYERWRDTPLMPIDASAAPLTKSSSLRKLLRSRSTSST